jgi:Tfp pilus assembly protein PilO
MTKSRTWTVGTAVLVVLILLAGWFLLVTPKRSHAADLQTQATSAQIANASTQRQITALQAQQQKLPAAESQLSQFKVQIPANPQLPAFIRTLQSAAIASGVYLTSISPANPTAMTSTAPVAAPAPTASASSSSGTPAPAPTPQSTVVAGLNSGVYDIEAQIVVAGSYAGLEAFEHQLEGMQRSVLVHTIAITSCTNGGSGSAGSGSTASGSSGAGGLSCSADSVAAQSNPLAMSINARIFLDPNLGTSTGGSGTGLGN